MFTPTPHVTSYTLQPTSVSRNDSTATAAEDREADDDDDERIISTRSINSAMESGSPALMPARRRELDAMR